MHKHVSDFLTQICEHIGSKYVREAVRSELASHLLDRTEALCSDGLSEDEAALKAVEAMGAPDEIGKRLNTVYKPDFKACIGGIALFFALLFFIFAMNGVSYLYFYDTPSILFVLLIAGALVLIGGYKNSSAEELLRRFSKALVYSGIICGIIGMITLFIVFSELLDKPAVIGLNFSVVFLSPLYGVIFSILTNALIPMTPTARLRKTPVSETLSI